MAARGDSVLYYGKVDKIGTDGSSLPRSLFVTPSALLVCLPAGGVTRSISLPALVEVNLSARATGDGPRCGMQVRDEPDLTVDFAQESEAEAFVAALSQVAGHVPVTRRNGLEAAGMSMDAPRRVVRFADPPVNTPHTSPYSPYLAHTVPAAGVGVRKPSSLASSSHLGKTPLEPLDAADTSVTRRSQLFHNPLVSPSQQEQAPTETQRRASVKFASPFRREGTAQLLGSPVESSVLYERDPISPSFPTQHSHSDIMNDLSHVQAGLTADAQQRLSTELELKEQTIKQLRGQLHECNAFIDDLKSALHAQEGSFQEMLKANEQLRCAEAARAEMDKQTELLKSEVQRLENLVQEKENAHREALATKMTELQQSHTEEVTAVREAFAQYDQEMSEYIERLNADHELEGRKWVEQQRLLQKQIEDQQCEIMELTNALAVFRHDQQEHTPQPHPPHVQTGHLHWQTQEEELGALRGNGNETRRAVNALSTSALEHRLASLEETRAHDRLREKLGRYAQHRRRPPSSQQKGYAYVEGKENQEEEEDVEEEGRKLFVSSEKGQTSGAVVTRRLLTPRVGNTESSALVYTPVNAMNGVRNRAIL